MDYSFLVIGLLFGLSTAGIPLYAFFTRKHFIRQRTYFVVQGLFWLTISALSTYTLYVSETTLGIVMNGILIILGIIFGSYTITSAVVDKGSFVLPYARPENKEAFGLYVSSLDVNLIKVRSMSGNKYDIVEFTDVEDYKKQQIMDAISSNPDLVLNFGTAEANKRLLRSFTFSLFIIAVAFLI